MFLSLYGQYMVFDVVRGVVIEVLQIIHIYGIYIVTIVVSATPVTKHPIKWTQINILYFNLKSEQTQYSLCTASSTIVWHSAKKTFVNQLLRANHHYWIVYQLYSAMLIGQQPLMGRPLLTMLLLYLIFSQMPGTVRSPRSCIVEVFSTQQCNPI